MTTINDNAGGFKKIEFLPISQIKTLWGDNRSVRIALTDAGRWVDVPFQRGTAVIDVVSERTDAGMLYNADVSVFIPHHSLTRDLECAISILEYYGGVIRYTTSNDEVFVVGSVEYPLSPLSKYLHPGDAAGFSCKKISLTGKSIRPPLPYKE